MSQLAAGPGEVFLDSRGGGRALRLTWHHDADLVVLSLWRGQECTGTFRLRSSDVDSFVDALVDGMRRDAGPQLLPPRQRMPSTPQQGLADWLYGPEEPHCAAAS